MDDEATSSWRTIRGQRPLNERRMDTYGLLMDAETRLDELRERRGLSETALGDVLEETDSEDSCEEEVYLATLERYTALLGGHVEVVAVFPEETVTLRRLPPEEGRDSGR
jgi:hypothetical protein